jgi:hypothetical protein
MKLRRALTSVGRYFGLLLVAIFICAVFWQYRVYGVLYYCSSPLIEFFAGPQFAHLKQTPFDHYLAPANRVARLWYALWVGCFAVPAVLLWIIRIRGKCVTRRMSRNAATAVAAGAESIGAINDVRFVSRIWLYFTHLLWTLVGIGLVALVILFKVSFSYAHLQVRHPRDHSDAAISDEPLLTLRGALGDGDKGVLYRVAFSPDGKRIASGDWSKLRVWDSSTGEALLTLTGVHSALDVAFSPDGKYLAESGHEHSAFIFEARTGQTVRKLEGLEIHGNAVAFSPDNKFLALAFGDAVEVREVVTGRRLLNLMIGDAMHCVTFSPDGQRLAAGGNDWKVRVWHATNGKELLIFKGHYQDVYGVAFSPDGKRIASASRDNSAKVWDAVTGREIVTFTGHCQQVWDVAFSPDGKRAASISRDGAARIWDAANGQELFVFFDTGNKRVPQALGVAFSPDGKRLATSFGANTIKVWKLSE